MGPLEGRYLSPHKRRVRVHNAEVEAALLGALTSSDHASDVMRDGRAFVVTTVTRGRRPARSHTLVYDGELAVTPPVDAATLEGYLKSDGRPIEDAQDAWDVAYTYEVFRRARIIVNEDDLRAMAAQEETYGARALPTAGVEAWRAPYMTDDELVFFANERNAVCRGARAPHALVRRVQHDLRLAPSRSAADARPRSFRTRPRGQAWIPSQRRLG